MMVIASQHALRPYKTRTAIFTTLWRIMKALVSETSCSSGTYAARPQAK